RDRPARVDVQGARVDAQNLALRFAVHEQLAEPIGNTDLEFSAAVERRAHRVGPGIDDGDLSRIRVDHEQVAGHPIERDGIRVVGGWNRLEYLERAQVEGVRGARL